MLASIPVIGQIQNLRVSEVQRQAGWVASIIAIIVAFSVVAIAGVIIGVWNLVTIRSTASSPLVAAIFVSAASIVLLMFFWGEPVRSDENLIRPLAAYAVKRCPTAPESFG